MDKTELTPQKKVCPKCKFINEVHTGFCLDCGCKLLEYPREIPETKPASGTSVFGSNDLKSTNMDSSQGTSVLGSISEKKDKKFKLILLSEDKSNLEEFPLKKKNTLGRQNGDILLKDITASSTHCELEIDGDEVILRDLKSKNGVFIRIEGEVRIKGNAEIRIGHKLFKLEEGA